MARSMTSRSSAGHGRACRADDAGFTLAESIVAFGIFIVISTAALWWLVQTVQITGTDRDRVLASQVATQQIERLRVLHNANQALQLGPQQVTLHGAEFQVTFTPSPSDGSCDPGTNTRSVAVLVAWGNGQHLEYDSEFAC